MEKQGISLSRDTIYCLLQECTSKKDLAASRTAYSTMVSNGLHTIPLLADHLIRAFASCGSSSDATQVFLQVLHPTVYTWNALISGLIAVGDGENVLTLYYRMQEHGIVPDDVTILYALKACHSINAITSGRLLHHQVISSALNSSVLVSSTLIDMYAKCGSLLEAQRVFSMLEGRNTVSWGVLISGYVQHGHGQLALELLDKMHEEGFLSDEATYLCTLKACSSKGATWRGRLIHDQILSFGLDNNGAIGNCLIDMYAKCGDLEDARRVFDRLSHKDAISWVTLMAGCLQNGYGGLALEFFNNMQQVGLQADKVALMCILKACSSIKAVDEGAIIHSQIVEYRLDSDSAIENSLVDMYAKCGSLDEAHKAFFISRSRDVSSWSSLIVGYTQHGHGRVALELYEEMQDNCIEPTTAIFSSVLTACGIIQALEYGRLTHAQIMKRKLEQDLVIGNSLVDMYAKCGILSDACTVFYEIPNRDVVSWGALFAGYIEQNFGVRVFELFADMQLEGIEPNQAIFLCLLKVCIRLRELYQARQLHQHIIESGFDSEVVLGSTVVDTYVKLGFMNDACKAFRLLKKPDIISWGAIIAGYAHNGEGFPALELFFEMQQKGIKPSKVIFLSILKACGSLGSLEQGKHAHDQILKSSLESDLFVGSALLDMYARCGKLDEAQKLFNELQNQDVVSWGSMIMGYAELGNWKMATQCLDNMQRRGLKPDDVVFTNILTACRQSGILQGGHIFFKQMTESLGIKPSILHYELLVELLAQAGHLDRALDMMASIPFLPDAIMLTSLLTGCRMFGNLDLAKQCFEKAVELDPKDASGYMLMSNAYFDASMWEGGLSIDCLRKGAGVQKKPGKAWAEVNGNVREFVVGCQSHPDSDQICEKMRRVRRMMNEKGHAPYYDSFVEPSMHKTRTPFVDYNQKSRVTSEVDGIKDIVDNSMSFVVQGAFCISQQDALLNDRLSKINFMVLKPLLLCCYILIGNGCLSCRVLN